MFITESFGRIPGDRFRSLGAEPEFDLPLTEIALATRVETEAPAGLSPLTPAISAAPVIVPTIPASKAVPIAPNAESSIPLASKSDPALGIPDKPIFVSPDKPITMSTAEPLPTSPLTQIAVPEKVDVVLTVGASASGNAKVINEPAPIWQVEDIGTGRAQINLDSDYRLTVDENSRRLSIDNFRTGETTDIWSDEPPVPLNQAGEVIQLDPPKQFWGTTTFVLENETRITVQTKAAADNADVYLLDKVVVTKGDKAVTIKNSGNDDTGDLTINSNDHGWCADLDTPDNFVLKENEAGIGWLRPAGDAPVTQAQLDLTAPDAKFGGQGDRYSLNDVGKLITQFFASSITTMLNTNSTNLHIDALHDTAKDDARRHAIIAAEYRLQTENDPTA